MSVLDIISSPWAITPEKLEQIREAYYARVRGEEPEWLARGGQVQPGTHVPYTVEDGVATIGVSGVIAQRANLMTQISGGTSTQLLAKDLDQALADPMVDAIVLAIDSPGGIVAGTPELAAKVFAARGQKPIAAWTDSKMLSAAYWIGSAAEQVFISSNVTEVGSIGVVVAHKDVSQAEANEGVKTTEIYAGKYKRIATSHAPLSEEGKAHIQEMVDYIYHGFVGAVASHRAAPVEDVLNRMAEGRVHIGKQAIDAGLVDGVASLDEVKAKLRKQVAAVRGQREQESLMSLTKDQVKAEHATIAAELAAEGAAAERARIKAINDASLPGHEALVTSMIDDGTPAAEAAVRILAAEKQLRVQAGAARMSDAPAALAHPGSAPEGNTAAVDSNLPVEERCKAQWDKDAKLQAEFGTLSAFVAYTKANERGHARILNMKRG